MTPEAPVDVHCPRCGYNLRGLAEPRCPECGRPFDPAELATGFLRDNRPTGLDRCDPWQPHQVLGRSVAELLSGALRPRHLLLTLDVNGPLVPALLMLIGGTFWLWIITAALMAGAIGWHTGASPAAALKTALFLWSPLLLLAGFVGGAAVLPLATTPVVMSVARPTGRQRLRVCAYWLPVLACYTCVPVALLCLGAPDLVTGVNAGYALPPVMVWLVAALAARKLDRGALSPWRMAASVVIFAAGAGLLSWLVDAGIGTSLEPPWWIYAL